MSNIEGGDQTICVRLWAKSDPYHPLINHMIDVGCTAIALLSISTYKTVLNRIAELTGIADNLLLPQIGFFLALHDLGKCHPLFQQKAPELEIVRILAEQKLLQRDDPTTYYHENESGAVVAGWIKQKYRYARPLCRLWNQILAQHHQRKGPTVSIDKRNKSFWVYMQNELINVVETLFQPDLTVEWKIEHTDLIGTMLSGLLVLSDWLASNNEVFVPPSVELDLEQYMKASLREAERTVIKMGFEYTPLWAGKTSFSDYWPAISPENMRNLQQVAEQWCREEMRPGLVIVEAPMGEGKTETAVYIASNWISKNICSGMYIALPTAATSNQMYSRISAYLQDHDVNHPTKLLHGMAWLVDDLVPDHNLSTDTDGDIARKWFQPLRRGLLAPWAVGTIDQALMAALKVRFGVLRITGLSYKVLIIDEVHAYDVYMTTILERLLNWCGVMGVPVILLSATLPSVRLRSLIEAYTMKEISGSNGKESSYPLITHVDIDGYMQQRIVKSVSTERVVPFQLLEILNDWPSVAKLAIETTKDGGCLCVIVNTVKDAQALYREIKSQVSNDTWLCLFHGRFKSADRMEIENRSLRAFDKRSLTADETEKAFRPQKAILIATQVVEQSLDLDFDYMITALAPVDLILQRLGRHQRHEGRTRPPGAKYQPFIILIPGENQDLGGSGMVYEPWIMYRTWEVLQDHEKIRIPQDMRTLVEAVYGEDYPNTDHPRYSEWVKMRANMEKDRIQAQQYLLPRPEPKRFMAAAIQDIRSDSENASGWLRAKTRLGNDQCDVIALEREEYEKTVQSMMKLNKSSLRTLMYSLVGIPGWWLQDITPITGCCEIVQGQGFLAGKYLLGLDNGIWEGINGEGVKIIIRYDAEYGLVREGV